MRISDNAMDILSAIPIYIAYEIATLLGTYSEYKNVSIAVKKLSNSDMKGRAKQLFTEIISRKNDVPYCPSYSIISRLDGEVHSINDSPAIIITEFSVPEYEPGGLYTEMPHVDSVPKTGYALQWLKHGVMHRYNNLPALIYSDVYGIRGTKYEYYHNGIRYNPVQHNRRLTLFDVAAVIGISMGIFTLFLWVTS